MSSMVNPMASVDAVAAVKQQPRVQKEQNSDGGRFKNMLSDAVSAEANPKETTKSPKMAASKMAEQNTPEGVQGKSERTGTRVQETASEDPQEQRPVQDEDDAQAYVMQAAMQMQGIVPMIADMPQTEIPTETEAVEAINFQPVQTESTVITAETPLNTDETLLQAQDNISRQAVQAEDGAARRPQVFTETQAGHAKTIEETGTVQQEQTAAVQQADQNRPQIQENTGLTEEAAGDITDVQVIRQHQAVQMHNLRHPQKTDAAQSRFDDMLAKASRELNPNAAEEAQTAEISEEATILEQSSALEAKPQETIKQAEITETEIPEAEVKPQEEEKSTARTEAQKSVKAPATEQRQQKEISKPDEATLGMVQAKQPAAVHEVIRSEPAQQLQASQVQVPDQAEQIRAQVIKNMEHQRTEFQMQLNPEELGKVNVKMILQDGKLSVEIMAANPKSAEVLSKQAESLAASLKAGNIEVSSVNVVTATENASANMNSEYNLNNFQNQFRNQADGQEQSGRSRDTGTSREQTENGETAGREDHQSPQRMLNYSI